MQDSAYLIAQAIWDNLQEMGFEPVSDSQTTIDEIVQGLGGQQHWTIIGQRTEEIDSGLLDGTIIPSDLVLEVKEPGLKITLHPFIDYEEAKLAGKDFSDIKKALLKGQGQRQKESPILIISRPNRRVRFWHITAGPNAIPCPQKIIDIGRQKLRLNPVQKKQVLSQLSAAQQELGR
ncbi:MAG: hypothetical protein COU85_01935 [Candidatus Portnoybacteria bacterium CG10_big_fil_rev_8_21_14_0_10_44_7]|uniref:Uncharacterized protein n=1 Tax=Candidatus Portnoybacteria bacterium CG10_big_fil_rev_8_21_14_0_10_44_7 TaxID=1974816 RepID=A0A2M8KIK5_9BACT|nr:MAG: hypothetical protein COU85_01935 [Candidatus Portnoybacteria bacterium CG10_big_fil_rev_8_21_14_0_10_44_7]